MLNLTNNGLYINYGANIDPVSSIRSDLVSGYHGTSPWNGSGLDSSSAAANPNEFALGYADSADGVVAGLASHPNTIEVAYTYAGDFNLDGIVNGLDLSILAAHFGQTGAVWDQADANYDGIVNGLDLSALAANFGDAGGTVLSAGESHSLFDSALVTVDQEYPAFAPVGESYLSAVPEPASMGILALGGMILLRRRRRGEVGM